MRCERDDGHGHRRAPRPPTRRTRTFGRPVLRSLPCRYFLPHGPGHRGRFRVPYRIERRVVGPDTPDDIVEGRVGGHRLLQHRAGCDQPGLFLRREGAGVGLADGVEHEEIEVGERAPEVGAEPGPERVPEREGVGRARVIAEGAAQILTLGGVERFEKRVVGGGAHSVRAFSEAFNRTGGIGGRGRGRGVRSAAARRRA